MISLKNHVVHSKIKYKGFWTSHILKTICTTVHSIEMFWGYYLWFVIICAFSPLGHTVIGS